MIIYAAVECILYTFLLIIIERKSYSFPKQNNNQIKVSEISNEDKINNINNIVKDITESSKEKLENEEINNNSILDVKNLQKVYKSGCFNHQKNSIVAVKKLNFSVKQGECFGLLGFSGAGKTTTFKCITQEFFQDKGEILFKGKDIRGNIDELSKFIGYCPQFNAIFENLTVFENLEFYARIKGINHNSIRTLVKTLIEEMTLKDFKNKISQNLSGGNKRKLSVAISILCNPSIILLDEPATGIDPEARHSMWSIIHRLSILGNSSVVMSTHSMEEAEILCKKIGIMINGEFVCYGKPKEIKEKYGKGYEINIRIKPINEEQEKQMLKNMNKDTIVNKDNIDYILIKLDKENFIEEFKEGRLGEKIGKYLSLNKDINVSELIASIFYIENALKFIQKAKQYFEKIILIEHFDNNFLFQIEKKELFGIGLIFTIFEENKDNSFVTEYSIQQASMEQIFISFSNLSKSKNNEIKEVNKGIIINDLLFQKLF